MKANHIKKIENQIKALNDSFFSILIIGERGTGKSSVLKGIGEKVSTKDELKKALEKKEKNPVIIDLIEFLDFQEQKEIFQLISTEAENKLANIEGKPTCPQLIFTTQKELTELYESKDFYTSFIDRIAQQIIKLPLLRKLNKDDIKSCWDSVNGLMFLTKTNENYRILLKEYNNTICDYIAKNLILSGNFRDLEKLTIFLWRFVSENNKATKEDFEDKLNEFKTIHEIEVKGEFFKVDKPADFMITEFRKALVNWAEKKYDELSRAELINKLGISEKTYYNWKNGL